MQPQFRQTPPNSDFSMMAVFKPNWEARIAATYPPGPLPITIKSKFMSEIWDKSKQISCCKWMKV